MTVSVIIPCFNRTELLRCSVASVLAQTRPAHEIIIVDDCTQEDIGWLPGEFPTVKILHLTKNLGCAGARYEAALIATGTHIATLDSDDHWYPDKLEKQVAYVEEIGDVRGVYSHRQWVEERYGGSIRPPHLPYPGERVGDFLFVRNGLLQSSTLFMERGLFLQLSLLPGGEFAEDWEMCLYADRLGCRVYVQEHCLGYWSCIEDSRRGSYSKGTDFCDGLLLRQKDAFTPRGRAAFMGRIYAPHLVRQGKVLKPARYLAVALMQGALSPQATVKLILSGLVPRIYRKTATWVRHFLSQTPR